MSSLTTERQFVKAQQVSVSDDSLTVDMSNGRIIVVPISWFQRLLHGMPEERDNWLLTGNGE